MEKEKLPKVAFGLMLFLLSLLLMGWLFGFFAAALSYPKISQFGVIVVLGILVFGIFYLFKIAIKLMQH